MSIDALQWLIPNLTLQYAFIERLAAAAIETIVLFVLVWLIAKAVGTRQPRVMAWLWIIVCLKPVATLLIGPAIEIDRFDISHVVAPASPQTEDVYYFESATSSDASFTTGATPTLSKDLPPLPPLGDTDSVPVTIVLTLWVTVGAGLLISFWIARRRVGSQINSDLADPPQWLQKQHDAIALKIGLTRVPRLRVSRAQKSPMVVGVIKPTVIMPAWMLAEGDSSDIAWSLRHELTHIRHHDLLVGTLAGLSRMLFFWLPPVWFALARWHESAEMACDSAVANDDTEAAAYADFLYRLIARTRSGYAGLTSSSMAAARTEVGRRIEAMLRHTGRRGSRSARLATMAVVAFAIMSATIGAGVNLMPPSEQKLVTVEHDTFEDGDDHEISDGAMRVSITGVVDIAPTSGAIRSIDQGGKIAISEISGGSQRQLTITIDPKSEISFEYTVDGKPAEMTHATIQWYQSILREFVMDNK